MSSTTYAERASGRYTRAVDEYRKLIFATGGAAIEGSLVDAVDAAILRVNQSAGSATGEPTDTDLDRMLGSGDDGRSEESKTIAAGDVDADVAAVGDYLTARQIVDNDVEVVRVAREGVTRARQALEQAIAPFHERAREVRARVEHANHLTRSWKPWEGNLKPDFDQCNTLRWEEKTIAATLELHRIPFDRAIEEAELSLFKAEQRYNEAERKTIEIRNARPWIVKLATEQRLAQSAT